MKISFSPSSVPFWCLLLFSLINSCSKEIEKPSGTNKIEIDSLTTTSDISCKSAKLHSQLTNVLGLNIINQHGHCWSIQPSPDISGTHTSLGALATGKTFSSNLSDLQSGTLYYVKPYITINNITIYGSAVSFETSLPVIPTITTIETTNITETAVTSGGSISSEGGFPVSARGVCWSTSTHPTTANYKTIDGIGIGNFTSNLTGLINNITYYARAYAINEIGISYGNEVSFTLFMDVPDTSVTDIDGNVYKTVKIGTQTWMAENLKVTKYCNGSNIIKVTDGSIWTSLTSGAYCDWGNSAANGNAYGHLYNFYAVVDSRQICPVGWHVPTQSEWTTLINYLGGDKVAGAKLKEVGTAHWETSVGVNSSGFTGLGGSWRGGDGAFYYSPRYFGCFWTFTISNNTNPWTLFLTTSIDVVFNNDTYHTKSAGNSIRCIKD